MASVSFAQFRNMFLKLAVLTASKVAGTLMSVMARQPSNMLSMLTALRDTRPVRSQVFMNSKFWNILYSVPSSGTVMVTPDSAPLMAKLVTLFLTDHQASVVGTVVPQLGRFAFCAPLAG